MRRLPSWTCVLATALSLNFVQAAEPEASALGPAGKFWLKRCSDPGPFSLPPDSDAAQRGKDLTAALLPLTRVEDVPSLEALNAFMELSFLRHGGAQSQDRMFGQAELGSRRTQVQAMVSSEPDERGHRALVHLQDMACTAPGPLVASLARFTVLPREMTHVDVYHPELYDPLYCAFEGGTIGAAWAIEVTIAPGRQCILDVTVHLTSRSPPPR